MMEVRCLPCSIYPRMKSICNLKEITFSCRCTDRPWFKSSSSPTLKTANMSEMFYSNKDNFRHLRQDIDLNSIWDYCVICSDKPWRLAANSLDVCIIVNVKNPQSCFHFGHLNLINWDKNGIRGTLYGSRS